MIDVEQMLLEKFPGFEKRNILVKKATFALLRRLFHEAEINEFLQNHQDIEGFDFIESVLEYFNFTYITSNRSRENIPATGRVVIIANHPLGSLDALSLLKLVGEIRHDVKIVANDMLMQLTPLKNLLLPIDNFNNKVTRKNFEAITDALKQDEAVIIFPAGEVSRIRPNGVRDTHWRNGFLKIARSANAPILPVFIQAKNSALFYALSVLNKPLSAILLVDEMFRQFSNSIKIRVGEKIPLLNIESLNISTPSKTKFIKKHLYRIAKNQPPLFQTESAIAHPENRQLLKQELSQCELLIETTDRKKIYLYQHQPNSTVMREIARLREIAFRRVGEGTGRKRDTDSYDVYYQHIVLWHDVDLEIMGSYRLGVTADIIAEKGIEGLYTSSLFQYEKGMQEYLKNGVELGRSFIQPKYWGNRSLDQLWQGIGAFLAKRSELRFLFGPVSLSNTYPKAAQDLIIYFYKTHFSDAENLVSAMTPHQIGNDGLHPSNFIKGEDVDEDFLELKNQLAHMGLSVPTLFKQYIDLTEKGGARFLDFSVDSNFSYCIDGLVMLDTHKFKPKKAQRYLQIPKRAA